MKAKLDNIILLYKASKSRFIETNFYLERGFDKDKMIVNHNHNATTKHTQD